jgi:hypothetical protein
MGNAKITRTAEYCGRYFLSDECDKLIEAYPALSEFWEKCEWFEVMLHLLPVSGYRNAEKL